MLVTAFGCFRKAKVNIANSNSGVAPTKRDVMGLPEKRKREEEWRGGEIGKEVIEMPELPNISMDGCLDKFEM